MTPPCTYEDFGASERKRNKDLEDRTRWLCDLMGQIERLSGNAPMYELKVPPDLREWWVEHKEYDAKEQDEEARRAMTHKGVPMEEI